VNKPFLPKQNFFNPYKPAYKECIDYFKNYLANYSYIDTSDVADLEKYWEYCTFKKNESLLLPGEVCNKIVFICKGYIKHFTDDKQGRHIINFHKHGEFCTTLPSFLNQAKALDGFISADMTYGLCLSFANFEALKINHPEFIILFHEISSSVNFSVMQRLNSFQTMDARGRYRQLITEHPEIFKHFTALDIANYLGIKPESLSRLKKEF
jgi:CRP-like cAMP-binding protein